MHILCCFFEHYIFTPRNCIRINNWCNCHVITCNYECKLITNEPQPTTIVAMVITITIDLVKLFTERVCNCLYKTENKI